MGFSTHHYRRARRAHGVEAHDEVERGHERREADDDDGHGRVDGAREVTLRVLHVARDVVCLHKSTLPHRPLIEAWPTVSQPP
jgi:hypothetical protein